MGIFHIVMLQFRDDASPEAIKGACDEMTGLATACVAATTGEPYIVSLRGGRDVSIEGMQHGVSHAFIVEFASAADRDYYVREDAAHRAFVDRHLGALVVKAVVVDFAPGEM